MIWGREIYIVGRLEEWSMFNNIKLFDVHNLSQDDITILLNVSNCIVVIDSVEFIKDRTFIGDLAVKSRVKGISLYVSAFSVDMLVTRFLENINHLQVGYLGNCKQSIEELNYTFNTRITNYVDNIRSYEFIKVI